MTHIALALSFVVFLAACSATSSPSTAGPTPIVIYVTPMPTEAPARTPPPDPTPIAAATPMPLKGVGLVFADDYGALGLVVPAFTDLGTSCGTARARSGHKFVSIVVYYTAEYAL